MCARNAQAQNKGKICRRRAACKSSQLCAQTRQSQSPQSSQWSARAFRAVCETQQQRQQQNTAKQNTHNTIALCACKIENSCKRRVALRRRRFRCYFQSSNAQLALQARATRKAKRRNAKLKKAAKKHCKRTEIWQQTRVCFCFVFLRFVCLFFVSHKSRARNFVSDSCAFSAIELNSNFKQYKQATRRRIRPRKTAATQDFSNRNADSDAPKLSSNFDCKYERKLGGNFFAFLSLAHPSNLSRSKQESIISILYKAISKQNTQQY